MPDSMATMPAQTPLAMAYVPYQQWGDVREPEEALKCGTLFTDLSFPFERGGSDR
ncbi:MAG: spore coat associated protein CotJA [Ruminococcus sp.]|nr:spore coat associated protein CotJA [Ruminococcus sp.]